MTARWQTSELRVPPHAFRDAAGAPVAGLSPTATVYHVDGSSGAPTATVAEIGGGGYRLILSAAPVKSLFVVIDGGSSLTTTRYVFQDIPVGGYVDSIDAATSTRATHAEATSDTAGTTTLLSRVTGTRAGNLDQLDAAVSTRASQTSVNALGIPAQASAVTALGIPAQATDWTTARASKVDNLDATISSRATAANVTSAQTALQSTLTSIAAQITALTTAETDDATVTQLNAARDAILAAAIASQAYEGSIG